MIAFLSERDPHTKAHDPVHVRRHELNLLRFYPWCIARALSSSTESRTMPKVSFYHSALGTFLSRNDANEVGRLWREV